MIQYALITYPRNTLPTAELVATVRRATGRFPRLIASGALAANIRLAVTGAGIALLPEPMVTEELRRGRLRAVRTSLRPTPLAFTASWLERDSEPYVPSVAVLAAEVGRSKDRKS